mgnify:CR=1 FL=1
MEHNLIYAKFQEYLTNYCYERINTLLGIWEKIYLILLEKTEQQESLKEENITYMIMIMIKRFSSQLQFSVEDFGQRGVESFSFENLLAISFHSISVIRVFIRVLKRFLYACYVFHDIWHILNIFFNVSNQRSCKYS